MQNGALAEPCSPMPGSANQMTVAKTPFQKSRHPEGRPITPPPRWLARSFCQALLRLNLEQSYVPRLRPSYLLHVRFLNGLHTNWTLSTPVALAFCCVLMSRINSLYS